MPNFKYRVRDRSGKAMAGTIDAPNLQMAGDRLFQLGYFPIKVEEEGETVSFNPSDLWQRFQQVKFEEIIFFSQQLSTLYKAGVPLLTGLTSLSQQTENKKLKTMLEAISHQVEKGSTLFGAIAKYPDVFTPVYVNMVRAGETSGMLGESLDRFVTLADRELQTRKKVKDAIRYPVMVIGTMAIAFIVLLFPKKGIIPTFAAIFSRFNTPLPLPTRIMIGINTLFTDYWYIMLGVLLVMPIAP